MYINNPGIYISYTCILIISMHACKEIGYFHLLKVVLAFVFA